MPITINIYNKNNQYTTYNAFLDTKNKIKNDEIDTVRNNNCSAPFRMSLRGTRKKNDCKDCVPNTKVLKDNHALYCCYNPYISNKQNKDGIIKNDFLYSNQHYLHSKNKLYNKNTKSNIIKTSSISGSSHTYQTTPVDNSNNKVLECHTITYKKSNYNHDTFGAVPQRNRINRLKYNAINARILTPKQMCESFNNRCHDENLARYRVDISKPPYCNKKTIFNRKNHTNKKISCNSDYTGPKEQETPQVTYIFPKFIPQRQPPPENGLPSDYYHNQYINSFLNFNYKYKPLEFNTNYRNRNPLFIPGPVPTNNTIDTSPEETYNFNVTEDTVTYTTQTPEVTTITETEIKTGDTETDIFLTNSMRDTEILEGNPKIIIKEVKIMNKTVRINVEQENISHWHYHLDNGDHNMVYSGNTVIFNVSEYGTYNLSVHGVDMGHNIITSAPAKILNIVTPTARYITTGFVAPFTQVINNGVVTSDSSNIISSSYPTSTEESSNTTTQQSTTNTGTTSTESTTTSNTTTQESTTNTTQTNSNTNTSSNTTGYN